METGKNRIAPIIDLMFGLWNKADRDFKSKEARKAFRDTCMAVLRDELESAPHCDEGVSHDSPAWASQVAYEDCSSVKSAMETLSSSAVSTAGFYYDPEDSDSSAAEQLIRSLRRRKINPATDRRFKANKSAREREVQIRNLAQARQAVRAEPSVVAPDEEPSPPPPEPTPAVPDDSSDGSDAIQTDAEQMGDAQFMARREKNSKPQVVPIPPLPRDYRKENEWIRQNIKSPDMLYTYVRKKTGGGVIWSGGLRKFFDSNDFWEFAFDTLSCGGWCDSENNKPISNVAKYITKSTIGEFVRHERSKYSIFDGKFQSGKELLEYIEMHCHMMDMKYRTEEYAEWFVHQMNEVGWRYTNGSTINNLPKAIAENFSKFEEWRATNRENLVGLNPSQYGETLRIQQAVENGEWKPMANGKFRATDLLKLVASKK